MTDREKTREQDGHTLEENFRALENIMAEMSKEDISLEDSFALYHRGVELLKACNEKIDAVEKKMLVLDEEGDTHEF